MQNIDTTTVEYRVSNTRERVNLDTPLIQPKYANHVNAVGATDHGITDYSISIWMDRWYLRGFYLVGGYSGILFFCLLCTVSAKTDG